MIRKQKNIQYHIKTKEYSSEEHGFWRMFGSMHLLPLKKDSSQSLKLIATCGSLFPATKKNHIPFHKPGVDAQMSFLGE